MAEAQARLGALNGESAFAQWLANEKVEIERINACAALSQGLDAETSGLAMMASDLVTAQSPLVTDFLDDLDPDNTSMLEGDAYIMQVI